MQVFYLVEFSIFFHLLEVDWPVNTHSAYHYMQSIEQAVGGEGFTGAL